MSINKIAAERNQRTLMELVGQPGNDVCADCKSRNPRWASHSLGIFICMNCASIHRKMGTHISKVKSLTMDTWSKEQVEFMKSMGNTKSNAHYNPDETKHPPPTNMIDQERDSDLEKFIRSKYQYKSFVTRSAQVAALLGPSRSASTRLSTAAPQRSATMPPSSSASSLSSAISKPLVAPALNASSSTSSASSVASVPAPAQSQFQPHSISVPPVPQLNNGPQQSISAQPPQQPQQPSNPLWNDLAQLQGPSTNSSLPLQFAPSLPPTTQPLSVSTPTGLSLPNPFTGLSASPNNPFPPTSLSAQPTGVGMGMGMGTGAGMFPPRSMSLNALSLGPMPSPGVGVGVGAFQSQTPLTAPPAPSPFVPSPMPTSLPSAGFGQQPMSAVASSFLTGLTPQPQAQPSPMFQPQPQPSPMFQPQPQPSPMFQPQPQPQTQSQPSPMYPSQPGMGFGQPGTPQTQTQLGNPFALAGTPQPQPQSAGIAQFSSPQVQAFAGSLSPAPFMQQQQPNQQMFGQQGMGMGMGMGGIQGIPVGGGMQSAGPTGAFGGAGAGWGQQPGFAGQQPWGGM